MSLLTEEQIEDLGNVLWERQTSVSCNLITTFIRDWNKKQKPFFITPPWERLVEAMWCNAPKWANWWAINNSGIAYFYEKEPTYENTVWEEFSGLIEQDTRWVHYWRSSLQQRPKPKVTPHPHAEIIAKYAEVAARRCDPWVEFELFEIGRAHV